MCNDNNERKIKCAASTNIIFKMKKLYEIDYNLFKWNSYYITDALKFSFP